MSEVCVQNLLPEKKRDLICLLQDFVADQGRRSLTASHGGFENSPNISKLQRKPFSSSDASSQSSSCGCALCRLLDWTPLFTSRLLHPKLRRPKEVFPPEKEGHHLHSRGIPTQALRQNLGPMTNKITTKVVQKMEPISAANGLAVDAHIVWKTATDSIKDLSIEATGQPSSMIKLASTPISAVTLEVTESKTEATTAFWRTQSVQIHTQGAWKN